jgi:hypothetical protein
VSFRHLRVPEALVVAPERHAFQSLSPDPLSYRIAVDCGLECPEVGPAVERRHRFPVLRLERPRRVRDPRTRDWDPLPARPGEDVVDVGARDEQPLADVRLVEVGREVTPQPPLEELVDVEGTAWPRPCRVREVAFHFLDDAFALWLEVQAEFLVEFTGELLGIHLVVLVVVAFLAWISRLVSLAVPVARLHVDWLSWLWLSAVSLADAAGVATVVLERREVDDLDRDTDTVGPRAAEISLGDELGEVLAPGLADLTEALAVC